MLIDCYDARVVMMQEYRTDVVYDVALQALEGCKDTLRECRRKPVQERVVAVFHFSA